MVRVVVSRVLWSIPLLFVVSVLTFVLVSLTPGDPARTILGELATDEQVAALRGELGLDRPIWLQYWDWLTAALRGDFGTSLITAQPVTELLGDRAGTSISLIVPATLLAGLLGTALGVLSAVRGGFLGRVVDAAALLGLALPAFWLGLVLIELFAVRLGLFPTTGYTRFAESPGEWLGSITLPVLTLAITGLTVVAGATRDAMLDVLRRDFVRVLHANGFARHSVIYKHGLRNAAMATLSTMGIVFVGLLSGTVLVESVFALPGLGGAAVRATADHDLPTIQGIVIYFTIAVVVVNLMIDIGYRLLDPRVRVS